MSTVHPLDEREMVASWGYDIAWIGGIGSYVGEWMALIRDGERWGFLWIGHASSTDRDDYELALPSCSWECRRDASCPHDWSRITEMSQLQRESITWGDATTTAALLEKARDEWDGPSSQDSMDADVGAMLAIVRQG